MLVGAVIQCAALGQDNDSQPVRKAIASQIEETPSIDGVLDDPAWKEAIPIGDFVQHEPLEGQPASEKTEVFIIYDTENLYVGVMCHDSEPSQILVTESERDSQLTNTDAFWMVFDTFLDRQNGFIFGTNPMGLEYDAQVTNEGQSSGGRRRGARTQRGSGRGVNTNWDANWEVAAHINDQGWVAEFKIPFNTLRFNRSEDQVWGVNFARNIRRKNEQDYWSSVPRQWTLYRLTFAGELHGLEIEPPTNFKVTPYVTGSVQRDFQGNPDGDTNYLGDGGFDVKYSLTPSMTLDLTYNTDFAQVEVDEQQVNLTRFNLFFPEKRPFFLENAGTFSVGSTQQAELFFSRRIGIDDSGGLVPILGGARLTGKLDRWNVGFLSMQTEEVGDCALGSLDCAAPGTNFTVGRTYREFGRRSRLGGIVTNKQVTGSGTAGNDYNRVFALDGRLGIGEAFLATGYVAKTSTFHEEAEAGEFDGSDHAYTLRGDYSTRTYRFWGEFSEVGENYNPEMGFLRRRAYRYVDTGLRTNIRVPSVDWLRELLPHVTYRVYHDLEGFKESEEIHLDSHVVWENGARFSPAVNLTLEGFKEPFEFFGVTTPTGSYRNWEFQPRFNSNRSAPLSVNVGMTIGGFYNGNIRTYAAGVNWRQGSQFTVSVNATHNKLDFPIEGPNGEFGGSFKTNLVAGRVNYSFTPRIFLQSLLQYNDGGDNWSSNIRFGWLNTAGTGLYVVYTETRDLAQYDRGFDRFVPPGGPMNRALYVKFTRQFQPF